MTRRGRCRSLVVAVVLLWAGFAFALEKGGERRGLSPEELVPGAVFDPSIPTEEALLGVRPGGRPLRHDELLRYLEALDAASPRAKLLTYARSHEDRRLVVLAVGDEATIARLEDFRAEHARSTDPRSAPKDEARLRTAKAVAWMAYGIHGDELSSSDAAAALAHWLVAGEDDRAQSLRRELVILIDPSENPDGRERFLSQTTSFAHAIASPDTEDLSHTTVWPWGRGNHYLFDLNRDWFAMVQPESARSAVIASWHPQLVVDSHEMGPDDTYLFSPPRHPFNPHLPKYMRAWWDRFAADQARALDARGYAYYTREWNEEFFPGYGSSWASYLGAVGILYEMSATEGTLVRQRSGTLRTYAQAVEHHVASSIANLETLRANRTEILSDFVAARREAMARGAEGPVRAWIVPPGRYPDRADALAKLLRAQGVEVLRAAAPVRAHGLRDARTGRPAGADLKAGTWMVPLDQPAAPLARVLLDPHVPMEETFLREEREHLERGKGSRLYDTTAWSLPLAYGLEAYWTGTKPAGDWRAEQPKAARGKLDPGSAPFGYVFDGTGDRSAFALSDLLERGLAVRIAERAFRFAGRSFTPGAVLVKREGNPEDLAAELRQVAERFEIDIHPATTARTEDGPDLGGSYFHPVVAPRVGIWTGMQIAPSAYGALWHLFDRQIEMRFTGLDLGRFADFDLGRYNVLIFPPPIGQAGGYRSVLGEKEVERLKRWIEAGGTAIGIAGGAEFLADKETRLTKTRLRRQALDRYPPAVFGPGPEQAERAGPFRAAGVRAPEPAGKETEGKGERRKKEKEEPPYDVAPILGPGAAPFALAPHEGPVTPAPARSLAAWLEPRLPPGREKPEPEDLERADERLRRFSPRGVFLRVDLDRDHWLGWGLPEDLPAFLDAQDTLVAEPPVEVAARFASIERLHLAGLLWPEAAGRLAWTAYLTREELGRGQIILFLDEPEFRGFTLATRRLLLNAILYGPGLGTRWSTPW